MASAWGSAWGKAWGNAWGLITQDQRPTGIYFAGIGAHQQQPFKPYKPYRPLPRIEEEEVADTPNQPRRSPALDEWLREVLREQKQPDTVLEDALADLERSLSQPPQPVSLYPSRRSEIQEAQRFAEATAYRINRLKEELALLREAERLEQQRLRQRQIDDDVAILLLLAT